MVAIPAPLSSNDVPDAFMSAVCKKCLLQTLLVCDNQYRLFTLAIKYGSASVPAPDASTTTGASLTSVTVTVMACRSQAVPSLALTSTT